MLIAIIRTGCIQKQKFSACGMLQVPLDYRILSV